MNFSAAPSSPAFDRSKPSSAAGSRPAVIWSDPATTDLRIGALSLLDRTLVAAHRAGFSPITVVCEGELADLTRACALGIPFQVTRQWPVIEPGTLVASTNALVQTRDLRKLAESGGRLINAAGAPLDMVMVGSTARGRESASRHVTNVAPMAPSKISPWLESADSVCTAEGVAEPVHDRASARRAENRLWASLTSSSDGWVDRAFNRPAGRILSRRLIQTRITPNQVTFISMLVGLEAALLMARGDRSAMVWGALAFQLSALIDCIDGDIARMVFKESRLGKWFDIAADQIVHVAVFVGLAVGLSRGGSDAPVFSLAASTVLGTILAFGVVVRSMLGRGRPPSSLLQRLIDGATSRDFSVLILVLALAGRLEWFLWASAIGVHLFWISALALQVAEHRSMNRTECGP